MSQTTTILHSKSELPPEWLRVVQLVVHHGRVTQIERTEKTRLPGSRESSASE